MNRGIPINLAFFNEAAEKTEKPTQRKKTKARDEGQVLRSAELGIAVLFLVAFQSLRIFSGYIFDNMTQFMAFGIRMIEQGPKLGVDEPIFISQRINYAFQQIIVMVIPLMGIIMLAGLIVELAQVGWHPTTKPMKPKMSKMSPLKGIKKIFSLNAILELVKSLLKLGVVGIGIYTVITNEIHVLRHFAQMELKDSVAYIGGLVIDIGIMVGGMYLVIALLDFIYQWWRHNKSLKMTKQEVKEEFKQTEGDPHVKGQIKRKMLEAGMRRMMQQVPGADVIITNPTHFAVALKYDRELGEAPVVLAKGADYVARRIKERALENGVEIVENKPLARTLYDTVDVGQEIPPELYQAVAEIFAYLANINKIAV
ncbi:MAG: flagellar biosynthesis protein FlhB [Clostridiales bacterium]|nr:flagellar biosynthesis protein FlhB [Clostridiales bacterium]